MPGSEACIKAWWKICVQYLWWRAYEGSQPNWYRALMRELFYRQKNCMKDLEERMGPSILEQYFTDVHWRTYEDELVIPDPEPLISYILVLPWQSKPVYTGSV